MNRRRDYMVKRRLMALIGFFAVLLITSESTPARTILVGPTRQYKTLQQITGSLAAGDTVLVDGDTTYAGGVNFTRPGDGTRRILVRGVKINGRRPIIDGGTNAVAFTGGASGAAHYTFEGFEVRNATFRGVYHQSGDLILRDLIVHHCNNGLMGADNGSGPLLLEYCEFHDNGAGTSAHQIYMATDEVTYPGSVFRMQYCYIHDGTGGNNVKSRAERNEIYYNWIEGAVYHELELIGPDPAGGVPADLKREDSDVAGNVLFKKASPSGSTGTFFVTRFGGDGTGESKGRYRVVNNTVVMGTSAAFRLFDGLQSVEMHNNVFATLTGSGAPIVRTVEAVWTSGEKISGQNNWVQSVLTTVPAGWNGTITGTNPGFRNAGSNDFIPATGSPLINAGTAIPLSDPSVPFPSPLFPPAFQPPIRTLLEPGSALPRTITGLPDIGAFEGNAPTGVHLPAQTEEFELDQNYPNPFNNSTLIVYQVSGVRLQGSVASGQLPGATWVELAVYDLLGREVAELVHGPMAPGVHRARFDAAGLPSGVYVYRLSVDDGGPILARRMVVIK